MRRPQRLVALRTRASHRAAVLRPVPLLAFILVACGPNGSGRPLSQDYPSPAIGTKDAPAAADTLPAKFAWVQTWGGPWGDGASDVAVTEAAVYVAGHFISDLDLDTGLGVVKSVSVLPSGHATLTKFDRAGNFVWNKTLPGTRFNDVPHVAVGANDVVYVTGAFSGSADFDPGAGEDMKVAPADNTTYLSSFTTDGAYRFTRLWAGPPSQEAPAILSVAADGASVYVLGQIDSQSGPDQGQPYGLARLDADGSQAWFAPLQAAGAFGLFAGFGRAACVTGSNQVNEVRTFDMNGPTGTVTWQKSNVEPHGVVVDAAGAIYVAGTFSGLLGQPMSSVDLDPAGGGQFKTSAGWSDDFVMKLDPTGKYIWAHSFGSKGAEGVGDLDLLPSGNLALTGSFVKTVDLGMGGPPDLRTAPASTRNAFVLELDTNGSALGAYSFARAGLTGVSGASNGDLYLVGAFDTATNFTTGCFGKTRKTQGHGDAFLVSLSKDAAPLTTGDSTCEPEPMLPSRNQTDPRLANTTLPKNFDECRQRMGTVFTEPTGDDSCELVVGDDNPMLFAECSDVGGSVAVPAGGGGRTCSLTYPEYGPLCIGCDF